MDELKKRIQKDAAIGEGDIVRVDMFLNHCMDMELLQSAGKALAKKFQTGYIDPDVYTAEVHSFSLEKSYTMRVSRRYLSEDDRVLLIDDILSSGQAMLGLLEIVSKAGAEPAGVGVAIEKATRDGGQVLRRMGLRVEALATIQRIEDGHIVLAED